MDSDSLVAIKPFSCFMPLLAVGWLMSTPLFARVDVDVPTVPIGIFNEQAQSPPAPWQVIQFETGIPKTHYQITQ